MSKLMERLRRDGWIFALIGLCVLLCLALGSGGTGDGQSSATPLEAQLSRVLSAMEGAGQVEVAVFYGAEDAMPRGAVVVAEGADSVAVRLQLTRAVCTLLGLEAEQVDIFKLGGGS